MTHDNLLTLTDYRKAYESGALTPPQAVEETYRRIAAHADPAIFITLRALEDVRAEAEKLDPTRAGHLPLFGIPVAVKDNIDVAGLPTTCACPAFAYVASSDATAVAKLRAAGALIIGKTNLDQFATGLVGLRSPYGTPRNSFRADLVPGGSSSGSAIAVAVGLVPVALGTDTAGSGRVPAVLNNIVGLKPTLGVVSTRGVVPACRSLDCVSVFALTVQDAWTMLEVLAGYDADDPYSRSISLERSDAPQLRIGVPDSGSRHFGGDPIAEAAFDSAVANIIRLGATVRQIDMTPLFKAAALLYDGPWVAERYQALRSFIETSPEALNPITRAIVEKARAFSAADLFAAQYQLAALKRESEMLWKTMDVLMVPSVPRPRTLADLAIDPIGPNSELGTYTNFVNLLDLCALAVPSQFRSDGLPAGATLIAPAGCDALLATIGAQLHARADVPLGATPGKLTPTPTAFGTKTAAEIELVVVGSHLSGLALNHELLTRGGRLLRTVATKPNYRLYALQGPAMQAPGMQRPGLLRVAAGAGVEVEAEVWALSPAAFGLFVQSVPMPLSIGTIMLSDGTTPKGFLVEAEAIRDSEDISHFGSSRAFLTAQSDTSSARAK
jgi:allophanate hydrolase